MKIEQAIWAAAYGAAFIAIAKETAQRLESPIDSVTVGSDAREIARRAILLADTAACCYASLPGTDRGRRFDAIVVDDLMCADPAAGMLEVVEFWERYRQRREEEEEEDDGE